MLLDLSDDHLPSNRRAYTIYKVDAVGKRFGCLDDRISAPSCCHLKNRKSLSGAQD
jgi:hypothetical protein